MALDPDMAPVAVKREPPPWANQPSAAMNFLLVEAFKASRGFQHSLSAAIAAEAKAPLNGAVSDLAKQAAEFVQGTIDETALADALTDCCTVLTGRRPPTPGVDDLFSGR